MPTENATFDVGIRKNVESDKVQYWLMIKARAAAPEEDEGGGKGKFNTMSLISFYIQLINLAYWKFLVASSVYLNIVLFISYFWLLPLIPHFSSELLIVMHLLCLLYWIDFIGATIEKVASKKLKNILKTRATIFLIMDAISLLPLSMIYLITATVIDIELLWKMRGLVVVRFYRIPLYFSEHPRTDRNYWILLMFTSVSYLILVVIVFANAFLNSSSDYTEIHIYGWNETAANRVVVSLYYTFEIMFNIGYGDIEPVGYSQMLQNAFLMIIGTAMSNGIFTGILGIAFTNIGAKREYYRYEYEAIKNTLKERKINKKTSREILNHMNTLWKYKKGHTVSFSLQILPLSLRKEIYFDINFVHLNRSLIFSKQPRWFLRSVALFMKNMTYLPGEIILEPSSMSDVMICVASGVIEVLSEENDESVLCSLTTGTIIGEATLFIPLPVRCFIRASTYVELQVLMKVDFARLALTYREIFRGMRADIFSRLQIKQQKQLSSAPESSRDSSTQVRRKRRETKMFLNNLRNNDELDEEQSPILSLYTLSENIPRVSKLGYPKLKKFSLSKKKQSNKQLN